MLGHQGPSPPAPPHTCSPFGQRHRVVGSPRLALPSPHLHPPSPGTAVRPGGCQPCRRFQPAWPATAPIPAWDLGLFFRWELNGEWRMLFLFLVGEVSFNAGPESWQSLGVIGWQ